MGKTPNIQRLRKRAANVELSKQRQLERDRLSDELALEWWADRPQAVTGQSAAAFAAQQQQQQQNEQSKN